MAAELPCNPYAPPGVEPASPPPVVPAGRTATLGQRLGGSLADGLFGMTFGFLPSVAIHAAGHDPFPLLTLTKLAWMPSPVLSQLTAVLPEVVQFWLIAHGGQTIGKKLAGTRIVTLDGRVAGFTHGVLLRWLPQLVLQGVRTALYAVLPQLQAIGTVLGVVLGVDILFIFRPDRRCLHDHVAGTRVEQT